MSDDDQLQQPLKLSTIFPIRGLFNVMADVDKLHYDYSFGRVLVSGVTQKKGASRSLVLTTEFEEAQMPVVARSLFEKAQKCFESNRIYKPAEGRHGFLMGRHIVNPEMRFLIENHFDIFLRAVKEHGDEFQDWKIYCDPNMEQPLNEDAIAELPELTSNEYCAQKTGCFVSVSVGEDEDPRQVFIPHDPEKLFLALVHAENTGASLFVKVPNDLSEDAEISINRPIKNSMPQLVF